MIDKFGRRIKDAFLTPMLRVVPKGIHPNSVTLLSLPPGVATALFAALGIWPWALVAFLLNRALDGLDGLLARTRGVQSDFGGYLDIMIDFLVYAAIPVGIWVGVEGELVIPTAEAGIGVSRSGGLQALPLVVLLAVFYVNAASWMYLSSVLEKRRAAPAGARAVSRTTTVEMPSGLVEGTETVLFYLLFLLLPSYYPLLFYLMAAATSVGVVQRLSWAWRRLR